MLRLIIGSKLTSHLPQFQKKLCEGENIEFETEKLTLKIRPSFEKGQSLFTYVACHFLNSLYYRLFCHELYA